ncbi:MAG: hypothetical protein ABIF11_02180 [Nitrospirota bacterium]
MKRYGNLFKKITSWENILLAAKLSARAKPLTEERMAFEVVCAKSTR